MRRCRCGSQAIDLFWHLLIPRYILSIFSLSLQGKVPILSNEAFHQLHIFIFVLAVTHVVMSATTIILGLTQVLHRESLHYKCMIY
jgi:hypothetical protein